MIFIIIGLSIAVVILGGVLIYSYYTRDESFSIEIIETRPDNSFSAKLRKAGFSEDKVNRILASIPTIEDKTTKRALFKVNLLAEGFSKYAITKIIALSEI